MHKHKILNICRPETALQDKLSSSLAISKILAQILINRNIRTKDAAAEFLHADLTSLGDPYTFPDMRRAVELIKEKAKNKEKVLIFGDYDVDGITSLAILKDTLCVMGIEADHYIPHRIKEGYGLNKNILQVLKAKKIKLLVTVDCGINSHKEIKEIRRHNIDVIVTDHHEPMDGDKLSASAVINPKLKGPNYKFRDLAGVGVAFKLAQALTGRTLSEELDLVCLGTIADVVPLMGENRVIAKEGLSRINQTKRIGLAALIEKSGVKDRQVNSTFFVSYILGPRLNASGRMDTAEVSLRLLLSQEQAEAEELAGKIEAYNRQRQKIESKILKEAEDLINKEVNFKDHKIIVIAKDNWHQGVLGIVASKISDRFYRPAILISTGGPLCKGSGRSINNFHLFQALLECKDILKSFGGHSHAVGLVIAKDKIGEFKKNINRLAHQKLRIEDLIPSIDIDMELGLGDLSHALAEEMELLAPYGKDNPEPLFYTRNLKLKGEPRILGRDTIKFWVTDGKFSYQAIGFGMSSFRESFSSGGYFDLVYTLRLDSWAEQESVLLEAKDIFF